MGWGIVLVILGILWLLSNFGWFSWDSWNTLWMFLPLALILWGLNYLLKDSKQRIPILLGVAVVGGIGLFGWSRTAAAQGSTQAISEDLQGATQTEVVVTSGLARLELGSLGPDSGKAIEGQVALMRGERLEHSAQKSGTLLKVRVEAKGNTRFGSPRSQGWNLKLSSKVPLALKVNSGVGENLLDLSGLKLSSFFLSAGVGSSQVRLPSQGRYSAEISGGVGALEVSVPSTIGLRLQVSTGLGGSELPSGLITKGDKLYESADYPTAQSRVDLKVSGGIGGIVVRR